MAWVGNELSHRVQPWIEEFGANCSANPDSTITIRSILNNDERVFLGEETNYFNLIEYFRRIYKDFLKMHDGIVIRKESFPPQVIKQILQRTSRKFNR